MIKKNLFLILFSFILIFSFANAQDITSRIPSVQYMTYDNPLVPADTINGNWLAIANFPAGAYGGVNARYWAANDKIVVAGGNDGTNSISNTYWYDPVAGTYTPKSVIPSPRGYGKMVKVRDSLFMIGCVNVQQTVLIGIDDAHVENLSDFLHG